MRTINSKVLQEVRETKGFSQTTLAEASGINTKTIKRIESGKFPNNRDNVIKNLARALGISESELTNPKFSPSKPTKLQQPADSTNVDESEMALKQQYDRINDILHQSQLNLRVSDRARNALSLTAASYNVSLSQIVEIAPLLFCWAAKKSLEQRQQTIEAIKLKNQELDQLQQNQTPHLGFRYPHQSDDIIRSEQRSIDKDDIFGITIDGDDISSHLPDDYDEARNNPFAEFLRKLTENLAVPKLLEDSKIFEEWDPKGSPDYTVCHLKALHYLAGDKEAAEWIINGYIPLHKIPKELRENSGGEGRARADWINSEIAAHHKKSPIELNL